MRFGHPALCAHNSEQATINSHCAQSYTGTGKIGQSEGDRALAIVSAGRLERCLPTPIDRENSISGIILMELNGKRIAILASHGFEQSELAAPPFPRPVATRW